MLMVVAAWSSAAIDSVGFRVQSAILEMLLFGGWAALLVGLAGWMLAERQRDSGDKQAFLAIETGLCGRPQSDDGPPQS
jgi:hypothetical protein